jgi:WD40 repeat protein
MASGYDDGMVRVWKVADASTICSYQGHKQAVWWVAWSPDGKQIASASWDGTVQVWDAANGHYQYTYRRHTNKVRTVAWSSDGKYIASGGFDDTVQIWSASGRESPIDLYKAHRHGRRSSLVA